MQDENSPLAAPETRSAFIALIGAPNAGKSTLLNRLVGAKVSIVTHKVQTTRALVRGIVIEKDAQLVFVDTPSIFKPRRRLDRAMVSTAARPKPHLSRLLTSRPTTMAVDSLASAMSSFSRAAVTGLRWLNRSPRARQA